MLNLKEGRGCAQGLPGTLQDEDRDSTGAAHLAGVGRRCYMQGVDDHKNCLTRALSRMTARTDRQNT